MDKKQQWKGRTLRYKQAAIKAGNLSKICLGLCLISLSFLVSCVPTSQSQTKVLFFSAEAWGGVPFDEASRKQVFTDALISKSLKRLVLSVPYESDVNGTVQRFVAIYEVDGRKSPPKLKSGYELAVAGSSSDAITLTNRQTGISWLVRLAFNHSGSSDTDSNSG